jgi:hypothetical protein
MNKKSDEIFEKVLKIVKAICKHRGIDNTYVPKEDIQDTMPCPVCERGTVTYTISSYNGHRSAQCSDPNCFGYYCE